MAPLSCQLPQRVSVNAEVVRSPAGVKPLARLVVLLGARFRYTYVFGDNLREILAAPEPRRAPRTLEWLGLDDACEFAPAAILTENIDYELAPLRPHARRHRGTQR
jgi:hypothetical protein